MSFALQRAANVDPLVAKAVDESPSMLRDIAGGIGNILDDYYGSQGVAKIVDEFKEGKRGVPTLLTGVLKQGVADPIEDAFAYTLGLPLTLAVQGGLSLAGAGYEQLPAEQQQSIKEEAFRFGARAAEKAKELGIDMSTVTTADELLGIAGIVQPVRGMVEMVTGPLGDIAMRGFKESMGDIIVPNYYGPRTQNFSNVEEWLLQAWAKDPGWDPNKSFQQNLDDIAGDVTLQSEKQNKARSIYGMAKWGLKGATRVAMNIMNPKSRALYGEFGLGPLAKEVGRKLEDKARRVDMFEASMPPRGTPEFKQWREQNGEAYDQSLKEYKRMAEEAHSQIQAMANIRVQSRSKARKQDIAEEFALYATGNSRNLLYFDPKTYKEGGWFHDTAARAHTLEGKMPSRTESNIVEKHVFDAWGLTAADDVRVIVKQPMSNITGAHFLDLVENSGFAGPIKNQLFDLFDQGERFTKIYDKYKNPFGSYTVDGLEAALKKRESFKGSQFKVKYKDDTGVYVVVTREGRKGGRGKVEGGVNMLIKLEPDGTMTGYMSDLHDFLEKAPGLGTVLKRALPTQVLAVSPPMQASIYGIVQPGRVDRNLTGMAELFRTPRPKAPMSAREEADYALKRMREINAIQPSKGELARQILPAMGTGLFYLNTQRDDVESQ